MPFTFAETWNFSVGGNFSTARAGMGVGLLPETARRLRSRLGREVVVDLLVLAALCVEYALRPAQRREIRGIVSISVANLRCFLWRDAPPVVAAGAYGLRGWNWRHADFYVRPRDRPAPWLRPRCPTRWQRPLSQRT